MQHSLRQRVTKRVAETKQHEIEFVEGYGVSDGQEVADTLEGVQSGRQLISEVIVVSASSHPNLPASRVFR